MTERRSFLARLAAAAAAAGLGAPSVQAQAASPPPRHAKDDWFDRLAGKHRMFFDATSPTGAREAAMFANNFFTANKNGYELEDKDLAVVIGLRHNAIAFAFDDAIWAKYGATMAENAKFTDPATNKPPATNLRREAYEALAKRGVHFAICDMSAHRIAGVIARAAGSTMDDIYKELAPHAVGGSVAHFVPAGIVAVNRSQERGYSIAYVG
ncbi:MAG TPA: twin-arginine translocation signal domain-containing protein [Vicinamibacterales bacterium]|jgi:intracellular sulfur oxidation DsrE/DsrF family protein|nr:twin-arginine translocation signal domain-containing protein [Vicinamibacterales bacterium]